jgi:hypothetical protein
MSHLPLWYLGKLDSDTCNQIIAEMSGIEVKDAAMVSSVQLAKRVVELETRLASIEQLLKEKQ